MKEDPGVSKARAWGCPRASPSPSTIISSSFSMLYFYRFICYVLCLERLAFTFLVCLVLLAVHNKWDLSLHCLGEKHAPLHPRTQHRFSCLSFCVFFIFSQLLSCLALSFHAYSFKSFYLGCLWNSLELSCLSCLESWLVALSCVSYFEQVIEVAIISVVVTCNSFEVLI